MKHSISGLICLATFTLTPAALSAQEMVIGKSEFADRCAVCHGEVGAGDGSVGELFTTKPKDLRLLAKENGGTYPFEAVYQAIDGRREVAAHGVTEMPIWGDYLLSQSQEGRSLSEKDAKILVEARILALVYYIQTIQTP